MIYDDENCYGDANNNVFARFVCACVWVMLLKRFLVDFILIVQHSLHFINDILYAMHTSERCWNFGRFHMLFSEILCAQKCFSHRTNQTNAISHGFRLCGSVEPHELSF